MTRTINDKKSADSEAANPCPSLFGEGSGVNRAVIAGWKKGVLNQAPPSRSTDFEVIETFNNLQMLTWIYTFLDVSMSCWEWKKILISKNLNSKKPEKCLSIVDDTWWRSIPLNDETYRNLSSIVDDKFNWRSILGNMKQIDSFKKLKGLEKSKFHRKTVYKLTFILQEGSIQQVEFRERNLETGKLDEYDYSLANIADITCVGEFSSVEDDFDSVLSDTEAATGSVFGFDDTLLDKSDNEAVDTAKQNCELPSKVTRRSADRRKAKAIKRQLTLTSDSSGASNVNVNQTANNQNSKKSRGNGTTPPDKNKDKKDSEKDKDGDKRRKNKKDKEAEEWNEIVKNTIRVDVKSSNGAKLTDFDFQRINERSTPVMMQLMLPAGDNWLIRRQGVAQYGLWYRVSNQATVETMKKVIPKVDPKCKYIPNADYSYQVFGPGECKTFNLRLSIPRVFGDWTIKELNDAINFMNKGDHNDKNWRKVTDDDTSEERLASLTVLGRDTGNDAKRREKELLNKDPTKGNVTFIVEFEDCLWKNLIEIKQGKLTLGTTSGFLEGFDIQEHVKLFLDGKPRPNRPQEFRGEIRAQKIAAKAAAKQAKQQSGQPAAADDSSDEDMAQND